MPVKILAVGDVVSKNGVAFLEKHLKAFKKIKGVDFTVVNGENASLMGITPAQSEQIMNAGADVITLGNHTWNRKEIIPVLDDNPNILRPSNFAPQTPGRGYGVYETGFGEVLVMNLIGRCSMDFGPDNPFHEADRILKKIQCAVKLVDMHAEATSEKAALAYYLDGRVSSLWGTHTHVQTSDARILPMGSGFISDLGMTGPWESVIGIKPEQSISMYLGNPRMRFEAAEGTCKMEGALFEIDEKTGLCLSVEAVRITE